MNKTFTPELDAGTLRRLADYAAHFAEDFNWPRQRAWCAVYLAGLLQDGERKSIEPLSRRVTLPTTVAGTSDPDQALQQFVSVSAWDEPALGRRYRALMAATFADAAGVFVLDDTTFPKAGSHSVGVQRQYCGALGKKARLPGRRLAALCRQAGPRAAGLAPVLARELAASARAAGQGWRARGPTPRAFQRRDRPRTA
jgi:SRSO17 transposase